MPGSFALLALLHGTLDSGTEQHTALIRSALAHYGTEHLCRNASGEFLGYFPNVETNTHNANLLGCAALTIGGRLLGDDAHLRVAASAASTSVAAIDPEGYIPYSDHPSGQWTDCYHHLYVLASVRTLATLNPHVDVTHLTETAQRLHAYYRKRFIRSDGLVNYYPDRLHPIDPHNYAATAIYITLSGEGDDDAAASLLRRIDELAWDGGRGRYLHRLHRRRRDARFFLRWTQVWMLAALGVAYSGEAARGAVDRARLALLASPVP